MSKNVTSKTNVLVSEHIQQTFFRARLNKQPVTGKQMEEIGNLMKKEFDGPIGYATRDTLDEEVARSPVDSAGWKVYKAITANADRSMITSAQLARKLW